MKRNNFLVLMLVTLAGFSPPAFAYLDPSTGSMILSAIVGLFATLALAVKTYWYKLKAFFRRDSSETAVDEKEENPASGEATTEN